jgi:hypothetical protein
MIGTAKSEQSSREDGAFSELCRAIATVHLDQDIFLFHPIAT